ncbi:CCA tRNA nucleotidyltransferase [Cyanobium sp. HWJ4-Hawea]|uniref:CCA tRNA nucleotidyltransferase n=1 Tax=Cyanobium sp. HWJ4-Hawea TaxID=2823713 RepID=UPI0020CD6350|nr:CCA tRNA nucleotidyltransferase [Cyanobium sp. HWJ4-Hawea]MCP9810068.1 CCA tRNA nucleotidyltransferase [Cyanobium sp. HWJ4-Hawea]
MPPRADQQVILAGQATPSELVELAQLVRQRLAANPWPLPPSAFPPNSALVGGAVRDALLDRLGPCPDLDLVIAADAIGLAKSLARQWGGTAVVLDGERCIARLVLKGWTIDLARQAGADLEEDLGRRDFSINAIACPLAQGSALVDPTGGLQDLKAGQLVAISEANLQADPLRLLRGLRLASELDFSLNAASSEWITRHALMLGQVAGERVLAELEKLADCTNGHRGLQRAMELGLMGCWQADPAGQSRLEQLGEGAASCRNFNPAETAEFLPLARLAVLFSSSALEALRSSRRLQKRCGLLRQWQTTLASHGGLEDLVSLENLPEMERWQLHQELEADLPALLLSLPVAEARAALARWRDPSDPLFHPQSPIDGRTLQRELGMPAGRELGSLLEHLSLERAFARLPGASPEVMLACRKWLNSRRD